SATNSEVVAPTPCGATDHVASGPSARRPILGGPVRNPAPHDRCIVARASAVAGTSRRRGTAIAAASTSAATYAARARPTGHGLRRGSLPGPQRSTVRARGEPAPPAVAPVLRRQGSHAGAWLVGDRQTRLEPDDVACPPEPQVELGVLVAYEPRIEPADLLQ